MPRPVFHQLVSAVLQMPEPPKFAPVDALLPPVEASVSQYRDPARTGTPNSDTARITNVASATTRPGVKDRALMQRLELRTTLLRCEIVIVVPTTPPKRYSVSSRSRH